MIKVYTCVSEISFNLKIRGNKRRINFDAISGGKSQYRTNEKDVQDGIEGLEQFGNLIKLSDSIEDDEEELDATGEGEEGDKDGALDGSGVGEGGKGGSLENGGAIGKDVQGDIISFAEAKEYLLTHGCEKTIRSREHITAYATELGIEFPNLK